MSSHNLNFAAPAPAILGLHLALAAPKPLFNFARKARFAKAAHMSLTPTLSLRALNRQNESDLIALERLIIEAPTYSQRVSGRPPEAKDACEILNELPPGKGHADKFVFGFYLEEKLIGCADVIRGYPVHSTAMLGLLLLSEKHQGAGLGRQAYEKIESTVRDWAGINCLRIAVVLTNESVASFWKKMGFTETGERKAFNNESVVSEVLVLEKKIESKKPRQTMRLALKKMVIGDAPTCRQITKSDVAALGSLMECAFRGTVDDDGESSEQFVQEIEDTLSGKWGNFIAEASFVSEEAGEITSASIVTLWKGKALLAYSATRPSSQGRGLAKHLIKKTINALIENGHTELTLGVTLANSSALGLYRSLGFEPIPS